MEKNQYGGGMTGDLTTFCITGVFRPPYFTSVFVYTFLFISNSLMIDMRSRKR